MFIKNQNTKFKIKIITRNMKYYKQKGYECKLYDIIEVDIKDLPKNSSEVIEVFCDYCLEKGVKNIIKIRYSKYLKNSINNIKDCCNKCKYQKIEENSLEKYGVKNISQLEEIKNKKQETCFKNYGVKSGFQLLEKRKQTCLEKYGVEYVGQNEEVKKKRKQTCLEKYGVEYVLQNEEIKKKMKHNNLEKYGVENVYQSEEIKEKIKKTCLEKYGVEYYLQSEDLKTKSKNTYLQKYGVDHDMKVPEIRDKIIKAMLITKYQNGTSISSRQQRYLHQLLGGELCYPVDKLALDIAFLDEMLYIEYNGSGHDACTKNGCSKEDFERRDFKRKQFLQNKGWKIIRIISIKDLLPQDEEIIYLIEQCRNYLLNSNHSWIDINIDNSKINCAEYTKIIKFNNLRKIK